MGLTDLEVAVLVHVRGLDERLDLRLRQLGARHRLQEGLELVLIVRCGYVSVVCAMDGGGNGMQKLTGVTTPSWLVSALLKRPVRYMTSL